MYSYWSGGGYPWDWYEAKANILRWGDLRIMTVAWVALAWVVAAGLRSSLRSPPDVREPTVELLGPFLSRGQCVRWRPMRAAAVASR